MKRRLLCGLFGAIAIFALSQQGKAQTTLEQYFPQNATGNLHGAVPSIYTTGSPTWSATTDYKLNGTVTLAKQSAWLPEVPAPGLYALTMDLTLTDTTAGDFFALSFNQRTGGFSEDNINTTDGVGARALLELQGSGDFSLYNGPGNSNLVYSSTGEPYSNTLNHATITMLLNTSGTSTTLDAYINGELQNLTGTGASYVFPAAPSITGIGYGSNTTGGIVRNIQFQTITPPPGANYFVAPPPLGNDSNAGTSVTAPFATIDQALSVAGSGSLIAVAPGVYSYVSDTATRTSTTTVMGYGPILPTITNAGNSGNAAVVLNGDSYLTFDHFALTNGFTIENQTDHITVQNCDMDGGYNGTAFFVQHANTNLLITGNHVHHWVNGFETPNSGSNSGSGLTITNNVFEYFTSNAIEFGLWDNILIDHNIIRYIVDPTGVSHNDGIQYYGPDNHSIISNNVFCHSGDQLNFFQPEFGAINDLLVENNIYYDCDAVAIQNQGCTDARYINNTIGSAHTGGLWLTSDVQTNPVVPAATDTVVSNNVIIAPDAFEKDHGAKTAYEDYNIVSTNSSGALTGAHDQASNSPGFISGPGETGGGDDFHPAYNANLMVGEGGITYATTTDLIGAPRSATAPTVGAYENPTSTTEPTAVTTEAEEAFLSSSTKPVTNFYDPNANGGAGQTLEATAVGDSMTYRLRVPDPGLYHILARVAQDNSSGQFQLTVDGADQGGVQDLYSSGDTYSVLDLGYRIFGVPGQQDFTFTVTGKNGSSGGYDIPLDYIQIYPQIWQAEYLSAGALEGNITHNSVITYDPAASDQNYVLSHSLTVGGSKSSLAFELPIIKAGTYDVKLRVLKASNLGQFQFSVNGNIIGTTQDLYSATNTYEVIDFGNVSFPAAANASFAMTVVGQNSASSDCQLTLDYIEVDQ